MLVRWIVEFTMPSGNKYAASVYEKDGARTFALVPFDPDTGSVRGAVTWASEDEAQKWIDLMREQPAGDDFFERWPGTFRIAPMQEPH